MTLFVCWVVFPLLLGIVSLGTGLLLERAAGLKLKPALVLPAGFAGIVVISQFAALTGSGARLMVPAVMALAAVGFALSFPWRAVRPDGWAALTAFAVFAVFAAPIVLTGEATFAGYVKLDDTSTFLALIDRALEHGRSLDGLAPSSYEAAVALNLPYYPLGSLLPLGIGAKLSGQDPAWVFQPYLAFLASMLALTLYELASPVLASKRLRAFAAIVAAQPALLYGYALWGGIKELAAALFVALLAALTPLAFRRGSPRHLLPVAVAAAALIGVLSLGGALWALPAAGAVVAVLIRSGQLRRLAIAIGALGLLLVPSLVVSRYLLSTDTTAPLTSGTELGNLVAPLSWLQIFGVWLTGDFRLRPPEMTVTYALIASLVLAAGLGAYVGARRRAWGMLLYAAGAAVAAIVFGIFGSPWVAAKAFAIGSPAVVLAAMLGSAALFAGRRRVEGAILGAAIVTGVVWSNALAYRETTLAPRPQLAELEQIGDRFAGRGPALMTEYQPYGVRHFLRSMDAEGASELRRRQVPLRDGRLLDKGEFADLDAFSLEALLAYRTLVLRRSPLASRPPAPFQRAWSGRFYEVWEQAETPLLPIAEHLSLGGGKLAARPTCDEIRRLTRGGREGLLAAPDRPGVVIVQLPAASGLVDVEARVATAGRYEFWLGGSFRGPVDVSIDGHRVGGARHQLNYSGQFTSFGEADLQAGSHGVRIEVGGPDLHPGSGGPPWTVGPLVLSRTGASTQVASVPRRATGALCRRSLDWVEARAS